MWGTTVMLFLFENSLVKKEVFEGVRCHDATANSYVTKFREKSSHIFMQSL
jgi:hypothetical protein